ncbi:MAG: hypothetical protein RLZ02_938 [Actinomycetota bacterium]|jgi:hypothetical protein
MITFSDYLKRVTELQSLRTSLVFVIGVEAKLETAKIANCVLVCIVVILPSSGLSFSLFLAMTVSQICRKKSHIPYTHTMSHPVRTV